MNKILIFLSLLIIQGCLISPKELDELNADNNFYSPVHKQSSVCKCHLLRDQRQ